MGSQNKTRCLNCLNFVRKPGDWTQARCAARLYKNGEYVSPLTMFGNDAVIVPWCHGSTAAGHWRPDIAEWMLEMETRHAKDADSKDV